MSVIGKKELKDIRSYVKGLLKENVSSDLVHHNWDATKDNINTLEALIKDSKISEVEAQIAEIATYFLYTGFSEPNEKPYTKSIEIAEEYLKKHGFNAQLIERVKNCLRLKIEDRMVSTMAEKLFMDMAFAYYGQKKLKKRISQTWEERNYFKEEKIDFLTSLEDRVNHMKEHAFFTPVARNLYDYRKIKNLNKLKSMVESEKGKNTLTNNKTAMTMFKTALRNHIDLINIADKKAGIMISINAILMTIMIPILGSYIIDISKFIIPSVILILTCGSAVILATMATRPQLSQGDVKDKDKVSGEKSLFYFGNFFKMQKEDYRNAVKDVIVRDISLENSVINDLYDIGVVLGIKYNRLRWCYIIFAGGIALTLITFALSFWIFPEI